MTRKILVNFIVLLLFIFSFFITTVTVKADDLVIQEDGSIELVITDIGILGVSVSPKEPEKSSPPSNQSNPPQHTEQKQSPPSPAANTTPQTPVKTVPLASPHTETTVQINPPINDDKKVQVTITTQTTQPSQPTANTLTKSQSFPTPVTATSSRAEITPTTIITKSVDQVVAQGANGKPVITIKSNKAHQLTIQQGSIQVETFLPLQIDTLTHSLSIPSQNKSAKVNVLPIEALQGILDKGILNTQNINQAKINLTQGTNGIDYTVNSQKQGKLFGIFSIKSPVQVKLSAQSGKVVKTSQSPLFSILGWFIK